MSTPSLSGGNAALVLLAAVMVSSRLMYRHWMVFARKVLDIQLHDLLFALAKCVVPSTRDRRARAARACEKVWSPHSADQSLCTLSVRTAFDLYLSTIALPPGSEVLCSAVTIPDMAIVLKAHGLVPVPIDMEVETLEMDADLLERAITPQTRAILVAHLFGTRMNLTRVHQIAAQYKLLVVEDCAQAFTGHDFSGSSQSDACMFSFGTIKTRTALGGAIIRVKDTAVLSHMRTRYSKYPAQSSRAYLSKIMKTLAIWAVQEPAIYGALVAALHVMGKSHDEVITSAIRGFPGANMLEKIREQPSLPLLLLLHRRLSAPDRQQTLVRRLELAHIALARLPQSLIIPGRSSRVHTAWLFPVVVANPPELIAFLQKFGFDATQGASQLHVLPLLPSSKHVRGSEFSSSSSSHGTHWLEPQRAQAWLSHIVYLPLYPELPRSAVTRLLDAVATYAEQQALVALPTTIPTTSNNTSTTTSTSTTTTSSSGGTRGTRSGKSGNDTVVPVAVSAGQGTLVPTQVGLAPSQEIEGDTSKV